jgi:hypothetical protein
MNPPATPIGGKKELAAMLAAPPATVNALRTRDLVRALELSLRYLAIPP